MTKNITETTPQIQNNQKEKTMDNTQTSKRVEFIANSCKIDGSKSAMRIKIHAGNGKESILDVPYETSPANMIKLFLSYGVLPPADAKELEPMIDDLLEEQKESLANNDKFYYKFDQVGWHQCPDGSYVFLYNDRLVEKEDAFYTYDSSASHENSEELDLVQSGGTLEGWKKEVLALSLDHPQLMFAMFLSFASAILKFSGVESSIYHIYGPSSIGKTSSSVVGASVFSSGGLEQWDASKPGILKLLGTHKDLSIFLDDAAKKHGAIAQKIADIQQIAYVISSNKGGAYVEQGSERLRARPSFSSLLSSSAEFAIRTEQNGDHKKGVDARLINIPFLYPEVVVEDITYPFYDVPNKVCETLHEAVQKEYGTPFIAYIEYLEKCINDKGENHLKDRISKFMAKYNAFAEKHLGIDLGDNFTARVSSKFGILYAAARLAHASGAISTIDKRELKKIVLSAHAATLGAEELKQKQQRKADRTIVQRFAKQLKRLEKEGEIRALDTKNKPDSDSIINYVWLYEKHDGVPSYYIHKDKLGHLSEVESDVMIKALINLGICKSTSKPEPFPCFKKGGSRPRVISIEREKLMKFSKIKKKRKTKK